MIFAWASCREAFGTSSSFPPNPQIMCRTRALKKSGTPLKRPGTWEPPDTSLGPLRPFSGTPPPSPLLRPFPETSFPVRGPADNGDRSRASHTRRHKPGEQLQGVAGAETQDSVPPQMPGCRGGARASVYNYSLNILTVVYNCISTTTILLCSYRHHWASGPGHPPL